MFWSCHTALRLRLQLNLDDNEEGHNIEIPNLLPRVQELFSNFPNFLSYFLIPPTFIGSAQNLKVNSISISG